MYGVTITYCGIFRVGFIPLSAATLGLVGIAVCVQIDMATLPNVTFTIKYDLTHATQTLTIFFN